MEGEKKGGREEGREEEGREDGGQKGKSGKTHIGRNHIISMSPCMHRQTSTHMERSRDEETDGQTTDYKTGKILITL